MRSTALILALLFPASAVADETIRSQAVVDLALDSNDHAKDERGKHPDTAIVKGKPQLISSPFWNQTGKALILDAGSQQYVSVPDSPDTDRADGVSISTFFLSLHPLDDQAFHGLFGKRGTNDDARTNYGINFMPAGDLFQVYLHDGPGFKVVQYGLKDTIGFSKLVHLTTTYEVADAPGADADEDRDDVRIRLFVNGRIVKPKVSTNGFIVGNDAWLTDIDLQKFLNDVPLTIGSSFGNSELTSGVYDEFLVFDRALSPAEAGKLFVELTGSTADQIAKRQKQQLQQTSAKPTVTTLLPRGLRTGGTTRVVLTGAMLKNADILVGRDLGTVAVVESSDKKLVADIALPADVTPGFYPLRAYGSSGVSPAVVVAVDRFAESLVKSTRQEKPTKLPGAFSGSLSGTQVARIWFNGQKGQRIVADVESRRLGSTLDPVVEIKNERGTPVAIEWRKHELHGDTRAVTQLPEDGVYSVELHDLAYRAPGQSPFRIRVGDLKVIDRLVPTSSGRQPVLAAVGTGLAPNKTIAATTRRGSLQLSGQELTDGPLPPVSLASVEISETKKTPAIDATFSQGKDQDIVAVNGTITGANETDHFDLNVQEHAKLFFTLKSRSLGSPLDGVLRVFNGKQQLASKDTGGTGRDIAIPVTVPKGAKQLRVAISDFTKAGGPTHGYRLLVGRADRVDFTISAEAGVIEVPENGSKVLRLNVTRNGGGFRYVGPIRLAIDGDRGLQISPSELPADTANREAFVVLTRTRPTPDAVKPITIVAETVEGPTVRRSIRIPTENPVLTSESRSLIAAATSAPVTAAINIAGAPPVLYRGTTASIPIQVTSLTDDPTGTIRFKLMSTEKPRDKKPAIRLEPNQFVMGKQSAINLKLVVPFDQVDPTVDFVVVGEAVDNPFSAVPKAMLYSAPISLIVRNPVQVSVAAASLNVKPEANTIKGTLKRQLDFDGVVKLTIAGLPKGYVAKPVVVPTDQIAFSIPLTVLKDAGVAAVPNVNLLVQSEAGSTIHANVPLALKVVKQ
ncbi:MAG: hypothetical protein AB8G99_19665 [Planctomycetaceae bacterium]